MSKKKPTHVALRTVVERQVPGIDAALAIIQGDVTVNGAVIQNPNARVRADAAMRVRTARHLHGQDKLEFALTHFPVVAQGRVTLDVGAAAGGFTAALLRAGARRVYAVDVGYGQLQGWLRQHPDVVNLERHNLADLTGAVVPDVIELVSLDLSYLAVADALPQLERLQLSTHAEVIALVKPTFELHAGVLLAADTAVHAAIERVIQRAVHDGWDVPGHTTSPVLGHRGAVEAFVHLRRHR